MGRGTREAVILAYRVRGSQRRLTVFPKRLDAGTTYRVVDPFSSRRSRTASGQDLMHKGLRLTLNPESALVRHLTPLKG